MGSPKVVLDQDPISLQINTSGMHLEHGSQTHTEIIDFDTTKTLQRRTRALNHFQTNSNKLHRLSISCSLTRGPPVFCGRKEGLHFLSVCLSIHVFFLPWWGGDVAQLVERRTGTPQTQVRFPGAARDFSPRVNFQRRLSYGVRTPPCAIACIYICAHVKDPVVYVDVRWIMETL